MHTTVPGAHPCWLRSRTSVASALWLVPGGLAVTPGCLFPALVFGCKGDLKAQRLYASRPNASQRTTLRARLYAVHWPEPPRTLFQKPADISGHAAVYGRCCQGWTFSLASAFDFALAANVQYRRRCRVSPLRSFLCQWLRIVKTHFAKHQFLPP